MKFPEFIKVGQDKKLRFVDIWRIYDYQFEVLREFIMTLGDKYVMEEFTGGTSKVLTLHNSYASGQLFMYKNNVIQWKDVDFIETSSKSVTLINNREATDVIRVVIVKSQIFRESIESYIEEIRKLCDGSKDSLERAQKLIEAIKFLELELDQKRKEFEEQRYILVDFLADFDDKYNNFVENVEKQEIIRSEVEGNANLVKELHSLVEGLHSEVESYSSQVESDRILVQELHDEVKSDREAVGEAESRIQELSSDVESKITELSDKATESLEESIRVSETTSSNLEESTRLYSDILKANDEVKDNTSTVQTITESVIATKIEVEENLEISETYLEEIRTIRDAIEELGHLTPEELVDNEVLLARNGAATLGTRLDDMVYKFETIEGMRQCRHLVNGDICLLIETSGKVFQVYRIITPSVGESIGDYSSTYYNIVDTSMYAYLLHDIMTMKGSGGSGTVTDVDFTEVYEKMSVLEGRVSALENSAVDISVDEDSVIIDTGNTES